MIAWSRFHKLLARDASAFLIFFYIPTWESAQASSFAFAFARRCHLMFRASLFMDARKISLSTHCLGSRFVAQSSSRPFAFKKRSSDALFPRLQVAIWWNCSGNKAVVMLIVFDGVRCRRWLWRTRLKVCEPAGDIWQGCIINFDSSVRILSLWEKLCPKRVPRRLHDLFARYRDGGWKFSSEVDRSGVIISGRLTKRLSFMSNILEGSIVRSESLLLLEVWPVTTP